MSAYAVLDENNIVINVITGRGLDEVVDGVSDWEAHYSASLGKKVLATCVNNSFRKQYAIIGGKYDPIRDEFVSTQPFPSWTLSSTNDWTAPQTGQTLEEGKTYGWDEDNQRWFLIG